MYGLGYLSGKCGNLSLRGVRIQRYLRCFEGVEAHAFNTRPRKQLLSFAADRFHCPPFSPKTRWLPSQGVLHCKLCTVPSFPVSFRTPQRFRPRDACLPSPLRYCRGLGRPRLPSILITLLYLPPLKLGLKASTASTLPSPSLKCPAIAKPLVYDG